jgi:hypothetical protein
MNNKLKFQNYCKGKIKDLGRITAYSNYLCDIDDASVMLLTDELRGHKNLKIIIRDDYEVDDSNGLVAVNSDNEVVIDTPMVSLLWYTAEMEFTAIDTKFYNEIISDWDDIEMDEYFEGGEE